MRTFHAAIKGRAWRGWLRVGGRAWRRSPHSLLVWFGLIYSAVADPNQDQKSHIALRYIMYIMAKLTSLITP